MSEEVQGLLDGAIAPALNPHLHGHEAAQQLLARSYASGRLHHAILIEGPEGIGKATLAFRFANHILSHPDPSLAPDMLADPDPQSPVSRQIAAGASHDLLHLTRPVDERTGKARTAITVEEVRRAGRFFGRTSGTGNWRIVIVDPADDLNRNAANAMLKMLEEPPRRALFLVLSHAPGKLLPTIRSRCQPLRLAPLADADLERALAGLNVAISAGAARKNLFRLATGSVSRALKLLNYGGLDIIAAFEELQGLEGPEARKAMHRLADALSGKGREVAFGFFLEHLNDWLSQAAKNAALAGRLGEAGQLAQLTGELSGRIDEALGYNLDRKQLLLSLLDAVRR